MPPKKNPDRDIRSQLDRDSSLTLQHARMLPATGSAVDMLPVDVRQDMEHDVPRAPISTRDGLTASARRKLDTALVLHGDDGITPPIPSAVEDEMIATIDRKRS